MKTRSSIGALTIIALAISLNAADNASKERFAKDRQSSYTERLGKVAKASQIIGAEVGTSQDERIGKIDDMAIDVETGRILEVYVSSGGILGLGQKTVAIPPGSLMTGANDGKDTNWRVDMTKDKFSSAPAFELSNWEANVSTNRLMESYRYFGKEPYFARSNATGRLNMASTVTNDYRSSTPPVRLEMAGKVIGASVHNESDEKLGKVDNLIVDLPAGRIVHVILSSGGLLGLGDDLRALPPSACRYREADGVLVVNATKDSLTSSPHFKSTEWPDFGNAVYSSSIYRAYQVEPYFEAAPDNTRRNVRDRDNRTLTPLDQGSSESDLDTTRRIRKSIVDEAGLSVNAQNVKVITVNGRITLRGTVNTPAEKSSIEKITRRIAPSANVDNQLEVKEPKN